jgi:hypothetical protein
MERKITGVGFLPPQIYIQRVTIDWTEESRGMPGAAKRNRCKICFPLTDAEIRTLSAGGSYSSVSMYEKGGFVPSQKTETYPEPRKLDLGALSIKQLPRKMIVRYHYSQWSVGAPDRSHRPAISCEIKPGELARVEYNGRFSFPLGGWPYHHVIFNVVYTDHLMVKSFLAEPDHHIRDVADLL